MIRVLKTESAEGDHAIVNKAVSFFGIPLYRYKGMSTNRQAVGLLTVESKKQFKIKGFGNETKDKSKKNK